MKVLVIGGTRFIGAYVVRAIHAAGAQVTVFHRGQSHNPILPDVEHVRDPLAQYPITEFPDSVRRDWDVVVHMVAMGEADAAAAVESFKGRAGRIVMASSGDVYRAYGILTKREKGIPDPLPLTEHSPLRTELYPYRGMERRIGTWAHDYEKVLAEHAFRVATGIEWTILRLPKVYGPEDNSDLSTVYGFSGVPDWRWTHGHVENVGAAIALAAGHPRAKNATFNIGELNTPSMGERLAVLPPKEAWPHALPPFDYRQLFVVDTSRVRQELGFSDVVDERNAMLELAERASQ
jgi:nucleoside-diphosphate-sugar epimerase